MPIARNMKIQFREYPMVAWLCLSKMRKAADQRANIQRLLCYLK